MPMPTFSEIHEKVESGQRLSAADGEYLFSPEVDPHAVGELADLLRRAAKERGRDVPAALESLGRWIDGGASPHPLWHERAHSALRQVAESAVQTGPLAAHALDLLERLKQVRRD